MFTAHFSDFIEYITVVRVLSTSKFLFEFSNKLNFDASKMIKP